MTELYRGMGLSKKKIGVSLNVIPAPGFHRGRLNNNDYPLEFTLVKTGAGMTWTIPYLLNNYLHLKEGVLFSMKADIPSF